MRSKKSGRKVPGPKLPSKPKARINPFEIHINKQKHNVLGKKAKNIVGYPGISRHKAIQKRKTTLLQEYRIKDKANKFFDKRIGEKNPFMTEDDKIMARFTAERMREHKTKASIFNIDDDDADFDVLTHKGKTLEEIEKFDDPRSDDEDDDGDMMGKNNDGRLDANFVEEAHFGGGLLSKSKNPNGHQDLIDKLIAESKKRKVEKMMSKEKTLELTQKLDATWKELIPLVSTSNKETNSAAGDSTDSKAKDSFDIALRQLRFEARGLPSDKLKSEDEIIREEKERLEKLEAERLRRMQGIDESAEPEKPKHRSADELDDWFCGSDNENSEPLAYNSEGKPISGILKKFNIGSSNDNEDKSMDNSDNEAHEEMSDQDSDEMEETGEGSRDSKNEVMDGDNSENSDEDDSEDSDEDDLSDLKNDSDSDDTETETSESFLIKGGMKDRGEKSSKQSKSGSKSEKNEPKVADDIKTDFPKKVRFNDNSDQETIKKSATLAKVDSAVFSEILKQKKILMESARKELPYTFKAPENYEELERLLEEKTVEQKAVIIERMIKCNHPSLGENNKQNLNNLFAFLLQHLNDLAMSDDPTECWLTLDSLAPFLYDLCHLSPENAANCIKEVIKEKQELYRKPHKYSYPDVDTLLFLKMVSLLFPTSDFRHPVITPCIVFMLHILHQCRLSTKKDIASALFIIVLILEYSELSKRFVPEVINVLQALLYMASPDDTLPAFLPCFRNQKTLNLSEKFSIDNCSLKKEEFVMKASDFGGADPVIYDDFKVRVIATVLSLVTQFAYRYNYLPSSAAIFLPLQRIIKTLQVELFPETLVNLVNECNTALETAIDKKLEVLIKEKEKPKILKLLEPKIVKVYDQKFLDKDKTDPKAEHIKLLRTYRKEMKGALREIRRDKDFLSRIKFKEQARSDADRRRKVKEIYSWGADQQGELNKMARKKKK